LATCSFSSLLSSSGLSLTGTGSDTGTYLLDIVLVVSNKIGIARSICDSDFQMPQRMAEFSQKKRPVPKNWPEKFLGEDA
jgi:hypothetical protein